MSSASSSSMIPGRSSLRKRPIDPKTGQYERSRARDAYRKQMNIFKAKFDASVQEHERLDQDAKQEIRIKAKRQREICLNDYRQGLLGLAKSSFRRTYKDLFLGDCESELEMQDPHVLEYELRLTSEMDNIIENIRILYPDKSNLSKLDWFANLAKAKFSYEFELSEPIDPDSIAIPLRFQEEQPPSESEESQRIEHCDIDCPDDIDCVQRPYSLRKNLYRNDGQEVEPINYRFDWQNLYAPSKPKLSAEYDPYSIEEKFDYQPFQPFSENPIGKQRNRYPEASLDPEWRAQSSLYAYHRPIQPSPHFAPLRIDTDLDSNSFLLGNQNQIESNAEKELLAGIDYEYKPIIPSYLKKSNSDRFNYDEDLNNDHNEITINEDVLGQKRESRAEKPSGSVHFDQ
ncbi:troponin I protein [Sarcoptes scabiei]|nr:troponin I protein [Sarcoptes scabiei]